jgi:lauroyl/myristoyl acyltransferase
MKTMKKGLIYRIAVAARFFVAHLPACVSYSIACVIGDAIYLFWPRVRRNMAKAVAALLNKPENDLKVRKTARRCLRNFARYVVDTFRYAHPQPVFFEKNFKIIGKEHLDAALADGKGIILVSFHLGNLDLGIKALGCAGYPVNAIVENWQSNQLDAFLQHPREKAGAKLIKVKEVSTNLLAVLRKNEILALMIDSPNCLNGVKVKLGEKWALLPTGPAIMALRTGARLIPCGLIRTSNTTFQGIIGKPIDITPSGNLVEDVRAITQDTTDALVNITSRFMDQWFIFHPLIQDE